MAAIQSYNLPEAGVCLVCLLVEALVLGHLVFGVDHAEATSACAHASQTYRARDRNRRAGRGHWLVACRPLCGSDLPHLEMCVLKRARGFGSRVFVRIAAMQWPRMLKGCRLQK